MDSLPDKLISAYLEGGLDKEQAVELSRWVQESPEHARYLASLSAIEHGLIKQTRLQSNSDILAELSEIEEQGVDIDPMAMAAERFPQPVDEQPSKQDMLTAMSYVFEHAVTPKRVAVFATAAAMLLGVVLMIVLLGGPDGQGEIADVPDWPEVNTNQPERVYLPLARITDSVGAQWRWGDTPIELPVGSPLNEWDRLTLTKGFAQITTLQGAEVLLQAPCTIELTNSDNAIRLHSGKLVGRCLTPESKGFIVHAPGLDVVDLGTEFGVEADAFNGSTVLVMSGSVRVQPTPQSPRAFEPVVLEKSQARRIRPQAGSLEVIAAAEAPTFYQAVPHAYVAAVLDAEPVAYWRFEEEQGRQVPNEIAPQRDALSMVGPATLTRSGKIGSAGLLTNRAAPYGYFETSSPIDQLSGFTEGTIEFWYYADVRLKQQEGYDAAMMLSLHDVSQLLDEPGVTLKEMIALELTDDGWLFDQERIKPIGWLEYSLRVYPEHFVDGEARSSIYTDHAHPVKQWQHVVLVKQADKITLYLDGEPLEERAHEFGPIDPVSMRLGRTFEFDVAEGGEGPPVFTPTRPFLGRLDEVALYDKPLTAQQIARHYELATGDAGTP